MNRLWSLVVVCLLALMSLSAAAQEATPPAGEMPESFEIAPGVTVDDVVFAEGEESPSLYRLHFEPGVIYQVEASPNLEIAYVMSGSLTFQLDGPTILGEIGAQDTPAQAVTGDEEVTVTEGQYVVLQPGVAGEVRNEGDVTAVVAVAGVNPGQVLTPATATPAS